MKDWTKQKAEEFAAAQIERRLAAQNFIAAEKRVEAATKAVSMASKNLDAAIIDEAPTP